MCHCRDQESLLDGKFSSHAGFRVNLVPGGRMFLGTYLGNSAFAPTGCGD